MKYLKLLYTIGTFGFFTTAFSQNLEWVKSMGGTGGEGSFSIAADLKGNVISAGSFHDSSDFDPGPATFNLTSNGLSDIFISKLDSTGNFVWAKQIGGSLGDISFANATDQYGNIYITGGVSDSVDFDPGPGTYYVAPNTATSFILKLDENGIFNWVITIGGNGPNISGITVSQNGNVYTTGYFQDSLSFNLSSTTFNIVSGNFNWDNVFISKIDINGNFIWAKSIEGSSHCQGSGITTDANENVYTTGNFYGMADFNPDTGVYHLSSFGQRDVFVAKLDSAGSFLWANQMGGSDDDRGEAISVDLNGHVYTTGKFGGLADFNANSQINNLNSVGSWDIFISKTDSSGNYIWAKSIGGPSEESGYSIVTDNIGDIFYTGYFNDTVDFDPGNGTYNLLSVGSWDIYHSMLDANGNFIFAKSMGGLSVDWASDLVINSTGDLFITGKFIGAVDFDPPSGAIPTFYGSGDVFVAKYINIPTAIHEDPEILVCNIFPNPASGIFTLNFSTASKEGIMEIFDQWGKCIFTDFIKCSSNVKIVDLSRFSNGIYFCHLKLNNTDTAVKIIKIE